ncbi:MAG TPA: hypothetical protein PLA50_16265, partial [Bacteroidia bacterium]|nr:hypothetical protein [Bacteroidia bacterium]
DACRLLLLDFLFRIQNGDGSGAVEALSRCGRAIRAMEQAPSIVAILAIWSLRFHWLDAVEGALDASELSPETRQGLVEALTLYAFDPDFPAFCARQEYARFKPLIAESCLCDSWEESSPVGKRLFIRQMELLYDRHRRLAEALSPETSPEVADAILQAIADANDVTAALLAHRSALAEVCYGTRELTEADGKRYAEAMIDCKAAVVEGSVRLQLGPLGSSLHELRTREANLIGRLGAGEVR